MYTCMFDACVSLSPSLCTYIYIHICMRASVYICSYVTCFSFGSSGCLVGPEQQARGPGPSRPLRGFVPNFVAFRLSMLRLEAMGLGTSEVQDWGLLVCMLGSFARRDLPRS